MAYDYETAMKALREADETGNTEDAKKLAIIANKLKTSKTEKESPGMMPFANRAIAGTIGAPVDLIAGGLNLIPGVDIQEPIGGRKSIERGMKGIGIQLPEEGQEPQTIPEHIGRGVGEVASMMAPTWAGVKMVSKGAGVAGKIASNIMASMAKHPYLTMISEATGGAGAGIGRGVGKEMTESPAGQAAAEMVGGVVGGAAPSALLHTPSMIAIRGGKALLRKFSMPFTEKGATYRAGEFLKQQVKDPSAIAGKIGEQTLGDLPPAVASGEKRLVTLYKSLVGLDPAVDAETVEKLSRSIINLEQEMRKMGYGSPELLAEITQKRIAALELRMDKKILSATEAAQKKLETVPVAQRKVAESRIVRNELETIMRQEQKAVQELWGEVPKDLNVGFEKTRETYTSLVSDLANAQRSDIPSVLKRDPIVNNKKLTGTTLKEMQGLRSKLLEFERVSRKNGEWNKARIAGDVADAILEDLSATDGSEPLKAAIAGTKQFKSRFESGIVGKILGYAKSGAPAIDPDLTLDISIGRMGQRGAVDINKVVITPEARKATERYLGRSFTDYSLDKATGKINPIKSEQWIKNNEAILDNFPEIRNQMTDAAGAQKLAADVSARMTARREALRNPKTSTAAKFLNANSMDVAIDGILKDKNPVKMAGQLVRQTRSDATGEALGGLRAGFIENILEKSTVGPFNELGEQTLSGRSILSYVDKNRAVLQQVFEPSQIKRMRQVGLELSKIEAFEKASAGKPDIEMKDPASSALRLFARIGGARLGGWMGRESAGGSLQMAQIYSGAAKTFVSKLTKDRAAALVTDALLSEDPRLLQSLLLPIDKPQSAKVNLRIVNQRLNLWLAGTGKRVMEDIMKEEQ